jgi:glutamyl-tRNA reductase
LYIDLAVPQDIDPAIAEVPNCTLRDIDYFRVLSRQNNLTKLEAVENAKLIIGEEVDVLRKELSMHEFMPYLPALEEYVERNGVRNLIFKLKSHSSSETFNSTLECIKELMG